MNQPFTVTGMTCGHCEMAVRRAVKSVDPQAEIKIDRADNRESNASTLCSISVLRPAPCGARTMGRPAHGDPDVWCGPAGAGSVGHPSRCLG